MAASDFAAHHFKGERKSILIPRRPARRGRDPAGHICGGMVTNGFSGGIICG